MGSKHRRKSSKSSTHQRHGGRVASQANDESVAKVEGEKEPTPVSADGVVVTKDQLQIATAVEPSLDEAGTAALADDGDSATSACEPLMTPKGANRLFERLFVSMLAANFSPLRPLAAMLPSNTVPLSEFVAAFETECDGLELSNQEIQALTVLSSGSSTSTEVSVSVKLLHELASTCTFHVEILEFEVRNAVWDRACGKASAKSDVQRVLHRLVSSLQSDEAKISSKQVEMLLHEKLAIKTGSALSRVLFSRICSKPFSRTLSSTLYEDKGVFAAAFEAFICTRPLSTDSVEGQLRAIISRQGDLRQSFEAMDKDHSGSIAVDELVAFLREQAQMTYPSDVLAAFVKRFDTNGDGTLDYQEFEAFIAPKHFGVHVLTPFGMFYLTTGRREKMQTVAEKIRTRMFWMQHNDLLASSTQSSTSGERNCRQKRPRKLKVTERFTLTHHFGTLRLKFEPEDSVSRVLKNGEMIVLIPDHGELTAADASTTSSLYCQAENALPPFEYRLKSRVKRTIPRLLSTTLAERAMTSTHPTQPQAVSRRESSVQAIKHRLDSRKISVTMKNTAANIEPGAVHPAPSAALIKNEGSVVDPHSQLSLLDGSSSPDFQFYDPTPSSLSSSSFPRQREAAIEKRHTITSKNSDDKNSWDESVDETSDDGQSDSDCFDRDTTMGDEAAAPGTDAAVESDEDEDEQPPPY